MVIGIIGESCVGKSTLAKMLKEKLQADVYTGKDYMRLAKSEEDAKQEFVKLLTDAVSTGVVIYVISEKEHIELLPAGALKIVVTADLETIEERFAARMKGNLPVPVKQMLERRHGCFDEEVCDIHVEGSENRFEDVYEEIMRVMESRS